MKVSLKLRATGGRSRGLGPGEYRGDVRLFGETEYHCVVFDLPAAVELGKSIDCDARVLFPEFEEKIANAGRLALMEGARLVGMVTILKGAFPDSGPPPSGTRTAGQWMNAMAEDIAIIQRKVEDSFEEDEDAAQCIAIAIKEARRLESDLYRFARDVHGVDRKTIDEVRT